MDGMADEREGIGLTGPADAGSEADEVGGAHSGRGLISIDDFGRLDLRVAKVVGAERVTKSTKLLRLSLDLGVGGMRQVVSGIAAFYEPEDMVGRIVVLVANLEPATIRGVVSQGMILCASTEGDGKLCLITASDDMDLNATVR